MAVSKCESISTYVTQPFSQQLISPFDRTPVIPSLVLKYGAQTSSKEYSLSVRRTVAREPRGIQFGQILSRAFCALRGVPMQKFISKRIKISDCCWANSEGLCPIAGADAHAQFACERRRRRIVLCSFPLCVFTSLDARGARAQCMRRYTLAHNACVPHYDVIESLSNRAAEWINI